MKSMQTSSVIYMYTPEFRQAASCDRDTIASVSSVTVEF